MVVKYLRARSLSSRSCFEQRLGVERYRRDRIVDIVGDAARHLAQRAQTLLLHRGLLRLAQFVIRLLQRRVELRLMRGKRDVLAQLLEEFAFPAAEASRLVPRGHQHPKCLRLHAAAQTPPRPGRRPRAAAETRMKPAKFWLIDHLPLKERDSPF